MTADGTPDIAWLFAGIALGMVIASAIWLFWLRR